MAMNQQNSSSLYNNYQQAFWRFDEQLRMEHAGLGNNSNSNMNTNNHVNTVVSSKWNFTPSNAVPLSAFANMNLLDNANANPKLVNNNSKTEARRNSYADHKPNNTAGRGKSKQKADKNHNVDWKHSVNESNEKVNVNSKCNDKNSNNNNNNNGSLDKRFKTLPATESLPRTEILGGYIFVCNNDTMQDDLKRQLFGLPQRYRDSVRAITPGLPLFLYNYTTHQLHGIFEASSFGGTNIDPTAWEDKKCRGESRFPAQVRIRTRKICKALEEDAFRPILHHYDGPKFRLQLSVPETLALLDIFNDSGL